MILTTTVLQMLYKPGDLIRPAIWLGTMFGVATIKSLYGVIAEGDLYYILFGAYGFMVRLHVYRIVRCFADFLPSVLLRPPAIEAFCVLHRRHHDVGYFCSLQVRVHPPRVLLLAYHSYRTVSTFRVAIAVPVLISILPSSLVVWYVALTVGLGFFFASRLSAPLFFLIALVGILPVGHVYSDVIIGEARYAYFMFKKYRQARRSAQDVEEKRTNKFRIIRTRRRRVKVPAPKVTDYAETEKFATPAAFPEENPFADVNIPEPSIFRTSEGYGGGRSSRNSINTVASGSTLAYSIFSANVSTETVDVVAPVNDVREKVHTEHADEHAGEHSGKSNIPVLATHHRIPDVLRQDASVVVPVLKKAKTGDEPETPMQAKLDAKMFDGSNESGYFPLSRASSLGDIGALASTSSSQMNSPFLTPLTEYPPRLQAKAGKMSFSSKLAMRRYRPGAGKSPLVQQS